MDHFSLFIDNGRKVKQMTGGYGPLYYIWSSVLGQPVLELTSTSSAGIYRAYVYGPSGTLLALQSYDFQFYWVHTDHLGSGRKLTDASGAMVYRAEFDPHGQVVYEWASGGATYLNSHKFTGYERNWATLLDDAKARSFAYRRARFMQPDPLGLGASDLTSPQSLNLYGYVDNDPVNFVDPSGLVLVEVCEADQWIPGDNGGQIIAGRCYLMDIGGGIGGTLTPPRLIDDIGGGGGGGGQDNTTPCHRFVDALVDFLYKGMKAGLSDAMIGRKLADEGQRLHNKSLPIGGVKEVFTMGSQKGEAYAHFASHAGAVMIGNSYIYSFLGYLGKGAEGNVFDKKVYTGTEATDSALRVDIDKMSKTSGFGNEALERNAEVVADYAGRDIGNLMLKASSGKLSRQGLYSEILSKLCDN